jgi:hypothetical protein
MSCDGTAAEGDVRSISAAGAPLARIAAIRDRGGAAGPADWVASEVSLPTLGGAAPPATREGPESAGGATGAGVVAAGAAGAAGPVAAAGLSGSELATAEEGVLASVTGAGAGATAGAGAGATAGAGAGSAAAGGGGGGS